MAPAAPRVALNRPLSLAEADYLPLARLAHTPRATTWLAVHVQSLHTVVIKAGRRGAAGDAAGRDVRDHMRGEFAALQVLRHRPGLAPAPLAFVDETQPLLVMADFRGEPLCELPRAERIAVLPLLAEAVARVHEAGLVHGDVKLDNAVRHADGVGLIDFELAAQVGAPMRPGGTPGHLDPGVQGRDAARRNRARRVRPRRLRRAGAARRAAGPAARRPRGAAAAQRGAARRGVLRAALAGRRRRVATRSRRRRTGAARSRRRLAQRTGARTRR